MEKYNFTWNNLENEYSSIIDQGYQIITCEEYIRIKENLPDKVVVNRIDIDFSVKKVINILDIFDKLNIKGTFFLRLHAPEYNPFSFENYRVLKRLLNSGHELGYHSEIVDQSIIWDEDAEDCLIRDLKVEGLSIARTQKEEFASILNSNNNDINVLFSKLKEFINN